MKEYVPILETSISGIKAFRVGSELYYDDYYLFYELEYKYHILKHYTFLGSMERYRNIHNIIVSRLSDVSEHILEDLIDGYSQWVRVHTRETFHDIDEMFNLMNSGDIVDYIYRSFSKRLTMCNKECISQRIFDGICSKDKVDSFKRFIDEFGGCDNIYVDSNELKSLNDNQLYKDIYKEIFYDIWFDYYKAYGIEFTLRENTEILDTLKSAKTLSDKLIVIHRGLDGVHTHGDMIEYLHHSHDISSAHLDDLSNMDTSEWEREMRELGFVRSSGETRRFS